MQSYKYNEVLGHVNGTDQQDNNIKTLRIRGSTIKMLRQITAKGVQNPLTNTALNK